MNWYKIFYWITVADNVSLILGVISMCTALTFCVSAIGFVSASSSMSSDVHYERERDIKSWAVWVKTWKRIFTMSLIVCPIFATLWAAVPTKKDALIIVAGGTVGNFITTDTTVRQIPAEVMVLLRDRIRAEIKEVNADPVIDTLQNKSKEELINLIRSK